MTNELKFIILIVVSSWLSEVYSADISISIGNIGQFAKVNILIGSTDNFPSIPNDPVIIPSESPTVIPPVEFPTSDPTVVPIEVPSQEPTVVPFEWFSLQPSEDPSHFPTSPPTHHMISTVISGISRGYVAGDAAGNLYFDDISVLSPSSNTPTTFLPSMDTISMFANSLGDMFIQSNNIIKKISNGITTTVLGTNLPGYDGENGPATSANIIGMSDMWINSLGYIYFGHYPLEHHIRYVNLNGIVRTYAGIADQSGYIDGPATSAKFTYGICLTGDSVGNLFVSDFDNFLVRKISNGIVSTYAGIGGDYVYHGENIAFTSTPFNRPHGNWIDSATGDLYLSSPDLNKVIRFEVSSGLSQSYVGAGFQLSNLHSGDGGPASSAEISEPHGLYADANMTLYIVETLGGYLRKVER